MVNIFSQEVLGSNGVNPQIIDTEEGSEKYHGNTPGMEIQKPPEGFNGLLWSGMARNISRPLFAKRGSLFAKIPLFAKALSLLRSQDPSAEYSRVLGNSCGNIQVAGLERRGWPANRSGRCVLSQGTNSPDRGEFNTQPWAVCDFDRCWCAWGLLLTGGQNCSGKTCLRVPGL